MAERYTKINGQQILADSVEPSDLKSTNAEVDNYVPSYDLATGKFTWISVPTTIQGAFDGGQTITVADGDNQKLVYTNNDVTNNPNCIEIINAATKYGIYINQTGVLAANRMSIKIYSAAAQVNASRLLYLVQDNASSTATVAGINNAGTGIGLEILLGGVLAANKYGIYAYSNAVQVNAPLAYFKQGNALSTKGCLELANDGSGAGIKLIGAGNSIYIQEKAAATGDIAAYGQIWIKTATPNELWFTDDVGTDHQIVFV